MARAAQIKPVHPGEILHADVLEPLNLSQNRFAQLLGVPANRINAIIRGQRSISADTAIRIGKCLGSSPEFWIGLQNEYDLQMAQDALEGRLESEVTVLSSTKAT